MTIENAFPGRDDLNAPQPGSSERNQKGLPTGRQLSADEAEEKLASSRDEDADDLETETTDAEEDEEPVLDEEDREENNLTDEQADWEPRR